MRKTTRLMAVMLASGLAALPPQMFGQMSGQMSGMNHAPAASGQMTPANAADSHLMLLEGQFMGVARTMPAEKYGFSPASLSIAGSKFDGVRTFAEQVKHVTQANYSFAAVIGGTKPDEAIRKVDGLQGKDEILAALASSFAALHKANATLTMQNAFEAVDFEGSKSARITVATFAAAHGFDHYGQMVEYLRMDGLVPPGSK